MAEDITAIISAYNEEAELPSLIENLKDLKDIVVVNHESTDKTAEIAEKLGARVYTEGKVLVTATDEDVKEFEKRYKFSPQFKAGNTIPHGSRSENRSMAYAKNDWILWIDADERVTWDFPEIQSYLPNHDIITCNFINTHKPDGSPDEMYVSVELARRSKTWFTCYIHQALIGFDLRSIFVKSMKIDHWQKPKEYRRTYLPILEFAYLQDQDLRTNYYLGREYFNCQEYEKSLYFFSIYLKTAYHLPEICKVYTLMSAAMWKLGREDEAWMYCLQAIRHNPKAKEPLLVMADMSRPSQAIQWQKYAALATE